MEEVLKKILIVSEVFYPEEFKINELALEWKNKGYEVIGITLKHLGEDDSENSNSKTCCSLDDIYDAKRACQKIGIMHYVMDAQEEFKKEVIDYFVESYNKGVTPSPCVICDEKIKIKKIKLAK